MDMPSSSSRILKVKKRKNVVRSFVKKSTECTYHFHEIHLQIFIFVPYALFCLHLKLVGEIIFTFVKGITSSFVFVFEGGELQY